MRFILTTTLVLIVGCGSAQTSGEPGNEKESPSLAPSPDPDGESGVSAEGDSMLVVVTGTWENASCGERKYNRRISFESNGEFKAVDEVAPCPEGTECVWSGIIDWKGTWELKDQVIEIETGQSKNERIPETLPDSFVVLGQTPLAIGEREGMLVCPYKRVQ